MARKRTLVRRVAGAAVLSMAAAILPAALTAAAAPGDITTFAGGAAPGPVPATSVSLRPEKVAVRGNSVYVADVASNVVRLIDTTSGTETVVAGNGSPNTCCIYQNFGGDGGPATSARINGPAGIALDAAGDVYFVDVYNYRVRRIDHDTGIITTVAGSGNGSLGGFSGDGGPATSAQLNSPQGLAIDANW